MVDNQKGFASILVLVILLIGLGLGVYLVQQKTNLFPKAKEISPSENTLLSRINDLEAKSEKIDSDQISGERTVKVPVEVFEDLNKNGIKDEGEVGIPKVPLVGTAFYSGTDSGNSEPVHFHINAPATVTDTNGVAEFNFKGSGILTIATSQISLDSILIVTADHIIDSEKGPVITRPILPFGWASSDESSSFPLVKYYVADTLQLNLTGETILKTAQFPIIGNQKISGIIFRDTNGDGIKDGNEGAVSTTTGDEAIGIWILLDVSKANNATRKTYIVAMKKDGSYEFSNLPPLSQYRVKLSMACPAKVTTPPYEGLTLGSAGIANYDFGFVYDENDPCVTQ